MLGITGPGAERFNQVFPEFIVADIARELDISGVERPHLKDISFLLVSQRGWH